MLQASGHVPWPLDGLGHSATQLGEKPSSEPQQFPSDKSDIDISGGSSFL